MNFGDGTKLTFDDMCREAARLGCYGFDMIDPADWPTLRKHGLEPLIAARVASMFDNGLIHSEVHKDLEPKLRPRSTQCAKERIRRSSRSAASGMACRTSKARTTRSRS